MSISASTSISAADRVAILAHLPDPVKEAVEATNHEIIACTPGIFSSKYMGQRIVVVYPSTTGRTIVSVFSAYKNPAVLSGTSQSSSYFDFPFKDKQCTHDAYQLYTQHRGSLPDDVVNKIYLFCLRKQIATQDQPGKEIALAEAIAQLIQEGAIKREQIDMDYLKRKFPAGTAI